MLFQIKNSFFKKTKLSFCGRPLVMHVFKKVNRFNSWTKLYSGLCLHKKLSSTTLLATGRAFSFYFKPSDFHFGDIGPELNWCFLICRYTFFIKNFIIQKAKNIIDNEQTSLEQKAQAQNLIDKWEAELRSVFDLYSLHHDEIKPWPDFSTDEEIDDFIYKHDVWVVERFIQLTKTAIELETNTKQRVELWLILLELSELKTTGFNQ